MARLFDCHFETIRQGSEDVQALPEDAATGRVRKSFSQVTTATGLSVVAEIARKADQSGRPVGDAFRQYETTLRDEILGEDSYWLPAAI